MKYPDGICLNCRVLSAYPKIMAEILCKHCKGLNSNYEPLNDNEKNVLAETENMGSLA